MGDILAVTGATGKSGKVFVDLLIQNSEHIMNLFGGVRLLTRSSAKVGLSTELMNIKGEVICGDLNDKSYLQNVLRGVKTVVHIAGINFSKTLVDVALMCGVRRLILVHTTGVYSKYKKAGEVYREIDKYCEEQCRNNGIVLTILRPTMIYGDIRDNNVVQFIKMVDCFPIMPVVSGARYALQPVHYADLAMGYYQVLMNENTTANKNFNLSGGRPILLRDMLIEIGKNLRKKVTFLSCPFIVAYGGAWIIFILSLGRVDYREKVQRLCEDRVYSHEDAKQSFNYSPRNFEDGIIDEITEYVKWKNR